MLIASFLLLLVIPLNLISLNGQNLSKGKMCATFVRAHRDDIDNGWMFLYLEKKGACIFIETIIQEEEWQNVLAFELLQRNFVSVCFKITRFEHISRHFCLYLVTILTIYSFVYEKIYIVFAICTKNGNTWNISYGTICV